MVRVMATVGAGGKPSREEGNPGGKGNPNCLPDSVIEALAPPSVKLARTDIQVLFSGGPRFSQSCVVQPAVVT